MPKFVDDGDIEFLYERVPMKCQICSAPLHKLSPDKRQAHYNRHFSDEPQASGSRTSDVSPVFSSSPKARSKSRTATDATLMKQNAFWIQTHSAAPPRNFTPGLIPTLKRALLKSHAKGLTTRAILCHDSVTHVATEFWDIGWGCGYRNFLMVCTSLLSQTVQPLYFPLLDDPLPPGVRNLQVWIEDAWANGFDREGAEQLRHKLVGTRKWIGTAELYVAFVSRGIPARLVDFPGSERGSEAVTEWVTNYFSPPVLRQGQTNAFNALKGAGPVLTTERMPLILQHSGHSRTIVGVEVNKKGNTNLLVLDPSVRPGGSLRRAALANNPSLPSPSKGEGGSHPALQQVLHPHSSHDKNRKRRASSLLLEEDDRETKRVRGGVQNSAEDGGDSVVGVREKDSDMRVDAQRLDSAKVLKFFRINQTQLGKKDKYQILWFPLDPPLDEAECWALRVVTSEEVV